MGLSEGFFFILFFLFANKALKKKSERITTCTGDEPALYSLVARFEYGVTFATYCHQITQ